MTSNKGVLDISVTLVPCTKIFTCYHVLLYVGMYAYIKLPCFGKKTQTMYTNNCLYFAFLK